MNLRKRANKAFKDRFNFYDLRVWEARNFVELLESFATSEIDLERKRISELLSSMINDVQKFHDTYDTSGLSKQAREYEEQFYRGQLLALNQAIINLNQ